MLEYLVTFYSKAGTIQKLYRMDEEDVMIMYEKALNFERGEIHKFDYPSHKFEIHKLKFVADNS